VVAGTAAEFLPQDPDLRSATESLFHSVLPAEERARRFNDPGLLEWFELIDQSLDFAVSLYQDVEEGKIRRTAIHGDTKIENFLFCQHTGRVRSLVDLDTIMPYTWLADWGDMVRSLCNVAGEKESDLSKVVVDREVYEAVTRGFLSTTEACPQEELARMPDAVATIAFELGLRFFTDYLRGDNYFQLSEGDPADLNRVRGLAQLKLFKELLACRDWAAGLIEASRRVQVGG
jgi:Ser/Thr protein kinase RdoA (MazF antagonist)